MKIEHIDTYRDGGSICYNVGEFALIILDRRIGSKTPNTLWNGYPEKNHNRQLTADEIREFRDALLRHNENILYHTKLMAETLTECDNLLED